MLLEYFWCFEESLCYYVIIFNTWSFDRFGLSLSKLYVSKTWNFSEVWLVMLKRRAFETFFRMGWLMIMMMKLLFLKCYCAIWNWKAEKGIRKSIIAMMIRTKFLADIYKSKRLEIISSESHSREWQTNMHKTNTIWILDYHKKILKEK